MAEMKTKENQNLLLGTLPPLRLKQVCQTESLRIEL